MPKKRQNHSGGQGASSAGNQWAGSDAAADERSIWQRPETYRWVAKNQQRWVQGKRQSEADGMDVCESGGEQSISVEEEFAAFTKEWQGLSDKHSPSNSDYYFNSYAHFSIHEDMLKDGARTGGYLKAIMGCKHLFAGKTVLDVGSGTGILCLFAAKAGAKKCIGIECSDIARYATEIAQKNGYGDIITYVQGKVEEVTIPVDQVDIIVSEWMGYFLIYESMLDSVLFARDKWLAEGGLMFPDHATLYVAGIEDADYKEEKLGVWNHWMGFDLSPMRKCCIQEPLSDTVDPSAITTSIERLINLDLYTIRVQDLDFISKFRLRAMRQDFVHALLVWFDVSFKAHQPPIVLSTAPSATTTHWKQTVLYFEGGFAMHPDEELEGVLAVRKSASNPRDLDVKLRLETHGTVKRDCAVQFYRLR